MKIFLSFLLSFSIAAVVLAVKGGDGPEFHAAKYSVPGPNGIQKNVRDRTAQPAPAPYDGVPVKPNQRIVAVGDLHGDLESCVAVLRMAGVIDDQNKWIGGNTILVQTGDIADRGPDAEQIWILFGILMRQSAAAGGKVIQLLGNHEFTNMMGVASEEDYERLNGKEGHAFTFSYKHELGNFLRRLKMVEKVGDTVFSHGGVSKHFARYGIAGINKRSLYSLEADKFIGHGIFQKHGPLFQRFFSLDEDSGAVCADLKESLQILRAKRMVIGHTIMTDNKLHTRCDGALVLIDIGISRYTWSVTLDKGNYGALEIIDGQARAIYPDRREAITEFFPSSSPNSLASKARTRD